MKMLSNPIIKSNLFVLLLFFLGKQFFFSSEIEIFNFFISALGILVIIFSGINFTYILKLTFRKKFDFWELLSISLIGIFIFYPLILMLEHELIGMVNDWLPLFNIFAYFLVLFPLLRKRRNEKFTDWEHFKNFSWKNFFRSPLFLSFFLLFLTIIVIAFTYPHLPDRDPWKWMFRFSGLFENNSLLNAGQRPLFSSFIYILQSMISVELFFIFKYVLPLFYLSILAPIWLVARKFESFWSKIILLGTSVITPSLILYSQTPMPQMMMIFLLFFFTFFLLHSLSRNDDFFYYFAGVTALFSVLYHESFILVFFFWIIVTAFLKRRYLFEKKYYALLMLLLALSNHSFFERYIRFISRWIEKIVKVSLFHPKLNLLFPLRYTNVDGNEMGWQTTSGLIKYYSFYAGPLLIFFLVILIFLLAQNKEFLKNTFQKIGSKKELLILFASFIFFFMIAEVFPRFPGIAMLPERAWIFTAIFFTPFISLTLAYDEQNKIFSREMKIFTIILIIVGISGSLYINNQKKYLITPQEISSAEWIKEKLPEDRLIISFGKRNLLKYYSNSKVNILSEDIFFNDDIDSLIRTIERNNKPESKDDIFLLYLKEISSISENYKDLYREEDRTLQRINIERESARAITKVSKEFIEKRKQEVKSHTEKKMESVYIYYSEVNPQNPYYNRPYISNDWGVKKSENDEIVLDRYPEKFMRVYESLNKKIIIWKVL